MQAYLKVKRIGENHPQEDFPSIYNQAAAHQSDYAYKDNIL